MSDVHVFTSAALNYIPKVRMLFQSIRKYHPEWRIHLVLADEMRSQVDLSHEPFDEIHVASDLGIPKWRGWAFCHSIVELATAVKPFMLASLLKRSDCRKVIYLDPDTVLFSRLDDVVSALDSSNILLTPHQTHPESSLAAVMDNEISSLKHGVFNLGFVAVSATEVGCEFAEWWSQRLYHFCRADIPNGLFTDQRWIDLVPAFFYGVAIMRSSRHNVATWNLTTRQFSLNDEGSYLVDGEPLGFYHFTGFDSGAHRVMAAKNAGDNGAVRDLIEWYSKQTKDLSKDPLAKEPWMYGAYSDGTPIEKAQRIVYRERVDLQNQFQDPFDASGYLVWWKTQGRKEYPKLFTTAASDGALQQYFSALTPGYQGGAASGFDWEKFRGMLREAVVQPKTGIRIGVRGWEILKNEGIKGIRRRLAGGSECREK